MKGIGREKRKGGVVIAQIFQRVALPGFAFEKIRDLAARPAMIRTTRDIIVPRIRDVGKSSSDGLLVGHKVRTISHSPRESAIANPKIPRRVAQDCILLYRRFSTCEMPPERKDIKY